MVSLGRGHGKRGRLELGACQLITAMPLFAGEGGEESEGGREGGEREARRGGGGGGRRVDSVLANDYVKHWQKPEVKKPWSRNMTTSIYMHTLTREGLGPGEVAEIGQEPLKRSADG